MRNVATAEFLVVSGILSLATKSIADETQAIQVLETEASKHPYYKFNYAWTRQVQDAVRLDSSTTIKLSTNIY